MFRLAAVVGLTASLALSACDTTVYSAIPANGDLYVLNRFTGNLQRIDASGSHVVAETSKPLGRPTLTTEALTGVPILVSGSARFSGKRMLVRVHVLPSTGVAANAESLEAWRKYMEDAQVTPISPRLDLQLVDQEGFNLAFKSVLLSELRRTINADGSTAEYDGQVDIPMSAEEFSSIFTWNVGWASWPTWFAP